MQDGTAHAQERPWLDAKLLAAAKKEGPLTVYSSTNEQEGLPLFKIFTDATGINVAPVIDPVAAVVLCADVSNVETVLVGGVAKKRDGRLVADVAAARAKVEESRDHLVDATERAKAEGTA